MSDFSLLDLFQTEVEQQSCVLSESLLALEDSADIAQVLESAMRAAHSIKGAARLVGVQPIVDLAHRMEDNLVAAQEGLLRLSNDDVDVLLRCMDAIQQMSDLGEQFEDWLAQEKSEYEMLLDALAVMSTPSSTAPTSPINSDANSPPSTGVAVEDMSMFELFVMETEQQAKVLTEGLLSLELAPASADDLEALMRASHSIKGAARLVGLSAVVGLAHVMEDVFVAAQNGTLSLSSLAIDSLLQGVDTIQAVADAGEQVNEWLTQNQAQYDALLATLESVLAANELGVESGPEPESVSKSEIEPGTAMADMSMFELFVMEAEQQCQVLNTGLLELEQAPDSSERLEPLMRAAHSIKGAARLVGLSAVVELAHVMEDVFVAAQNGDILLSPAQIDILLSGVDTMADAAAFSAGPEAWFSANQQSYQNLLVGLKGVRVGETTAPTKVAATAEVVTEPVLEASVAEPIELKAAVKKEQSPQKDRVLRVSADQINRLMGLAGEAMVDSRWLYPFAGSLQRLKRQQTELVRILDNLRDQLDGQNIEEATFSLACTAQKQASYCRELLADRLSELEAFDRRSANLSSRLHREVVQSRMRPFGDGVHGFPRMVRDISRKLGKDVQLVIEGETSMVDRDILDKIEAPLNHIIRNAIDHGLEMPEERQAADKVAKGTIKLSAYHHAGMLSIVVEDNGRGVDLERLRAKVVAKGLVDQVMAETLSELELMEFLFLPSFSTRDAVSEISGRGVGLDVVHDVMQEMRGSVRASSTYGKGTRFHMQLPLTLSVIPALLVDVIDEPYAFPLARIDRILRIDRQSIQEAEGNQFVCIDGKNIGLVSAAQVLGMGDEYEFPESLSVVVLSDRNQYYGMVVDRFVGERELVVQVMPAQLGKVQDISSAALMEDGSPALIIDVDDMIRSMEKTLKVSRLGRVASIDEAMQTNKRVLVVDDSITVREVERKLLQAAGYSVDVAVDGMDGLNALRSGQFDLLITDVDMPRMNGIELTRTVRQDPQLRSLPILMVSYKDREEDRMRGLEAGADHYLTKGSFHDESLRNVVVELIGRANE